MDLEQQVERLKRDNRRLKIALGAVAALLVAAVLVGV